ncbi:MAG: glycoside hydrolase family 95 protein [Bryobacteraceae bacterium]
MTRQRRFRLTEALLLLAVASPNAPLRASEADFRLLYDKPAAKWTEALPLGNGRIGAMVFGGTEDERLQINEGTLWGGAPHDYANPKAYTHLEEIRRLIFAGKVGEAEELSEALMGDPKLLMPYQPFCDLRLHFPDHGVVTEYHRELRLDDAMADTTYKAGSTELRREVFVSYPDQVLVVRVASSQPGQLAFTVGMDSPQPGTDVATTGNDTLQLTGQIQPRQNSVRSWTGSWDKPGMRFAAVLKVLTEGGSVRSVSGHLEISGAIAATIVFSNATSFRNYRDIGGDALDAAQGYVRQASEKSYDQLRRRHVDDFQRLFSRVQLRLGRDQSTETTDRRIRSFAENDDPGLLALYFAFGRYLLISSSRPGGQPANLQGIWNQDLAPAWGSKWTTNINLEMNYWQADTGDLWETEEPLWSLIRDLRVTGSETARVEYHSGGWVLHHNTDLWRATAPVDGPWGIWPVGEVWLANQMWDHYEFSGDAEFLRRQAYPAMKEAAEFALGFLVEAPPGTPFAGRLVTNPSTSPENRYILNGKPENLTYAPAMDIELIGELFDNCRRAAEILGIDAELRSELDRVRKRLPPLQIGKRGQLQEWIEDYPEAEPTHRHVSHLYSLYPGHDISLSTTPELAAAAKRTLELRGNGGTGWSEVWRTALWARLRNPDHAYANLKLLLTKNTLPNMFDLCPPFQIDGNLGGPAAITEMLVQSTDKEISVLPALPRHWSSGSLTGVRVRGGGRVDLGWTQSHLAELSLSADRAMRYLVLYGDQSADVELHPGKAVVLDGNLHRVGK